MKRTVRSLLPGALICLAATNLPAQHQAIRGGAGPLHSSGHGLPHAASSGPALVVGRAGGGWAGPGFGPGSAYIPGYQPGGPATISGPAAVGAGGGSSGSAFPFGGFVAAPTAFSAMQVGPGGLWLSGFLPTSSSAVPTPPLVPVTTQADRPNRAAELVEIGNRNFRGGNLRRAEDRYHTAARSDAEAPDPHVRLAQVAVVRGDYNKAAAAFREAVAASRSPGWLLQVPDIQSMFGEPRDFAKQIARLETHLQAHPQDRNAWFVLGAEYFLSGRHQQAQDAFLRLADQPADEALTAFQDATTIARRSDGVAEPTRTVSQ